MVSDLRKDRLSFFRNDRAARSPALPELIDVIWEGGGYGARRDRLPFRFQAYAPDPIAEWDAALATRAADAVAGATARLAEIEADRARLDLEVLAGPLLRAEALGSSFIEGLRASNKRVALAAYEPVAADTTARAVLGNVRAMEQAIDLGSSRRRFTLDDLVEIHHTLLAGTSEERHAGVIRSGQNWIGGRGVSPRDATFVPPPADRVPDLLRDLVEFVNLDDLPAVAQAAIVHAQFETIHPFGDGNGRAGRCLIHVVLRRRAVTPNFVAPVSIVLATEARRYIAGLTDFREGRIDDWIGYFADSTSRAANATQHLGALVEQFLEELIVLAGSPRANSVKRRIILDLPAQPVVSADSAASRHGVTPTAARTALNQLEAAGVLTPTRVGRRRNREWISEQLFRLLDDFERDLGTPD